MESEGDLIEHTTKAIVRRARAAITAHRLFRDLCLRLAGGPSRFGAAYTRAQPVSTQR